MPLYSYRCDACHTTREILAKMSDPPPEGCDSCGALGHMRKLLARTSFQLKGGGWYSQGYEGSSNREASTTSEGAAAKPSGSGVDGGSTTGTGGASESRTGGDATPVHKSGG